MSEPLYMWTVYDHPTDFPNTFVARKFAVDARGARATNDIIVSPGLDTLRGVLAQKGLTCLTRSPQDDAKIVETWL